MQTTARLMKHGVSPSASVVPSTLIAAAMPCRDHEASIGGGSKGKG